MTRKKNIQIVSAVCLSLFAFATNGTAQKPELITEEGHTSVVRALAFSPDGTLLASGSEDKKIKIWNVRAELELRTIAGDGGTITFLGFTDNQTLISADDVGRVRIWNTILGKELPKPGSLGCDLNNSCRIILALSSDHKTLAVAGKGPEITFWDTQTQVKKKEHINSQVSTIGMAFDRAADLLAVGHEDGNIEIWKLSSEAKPLLLSTGRTTGSLSMAFSPDAKYLVSGGPGSQIRVWSTQTSEPVTPLNGHAGGVNSIVFDADGRLITAGGDGDIKVWVFPTRKEICTLHEKKAVRALAVNESRRDEFASGGNNSAVSIWSVSGRRQIYEWRAHTFSVTDIAFNSKGDILATAHSPTVKLWNLATGRELRTLRTVEGWLYSLAFSRDGTRLATGLGGNFGYQINIWNLEATDAPPLQIKDRVAFAVAFSPDGKTLATCDHAGRISLWEVNTGELLWQWQVELVPGGASPAHLIAFTRNGLLITGGSDGIIRFWEPDRKEPTKTIDAHIGPIISLDVTSEGNMLAARGANAIKVWDLGSGNELPMTLPIPGYPSSIKFSPDGKYIAAGGYEYDSKGALIAPIRVWEVKTGKLRPLMLGHMHGITSVGFNHDGTRVVSSSWDNSWRVWDVESGKELCNVIALDQNDWVAVTPEGRFDGSPDGRRLIHWRIGDEVIGLEQLQEKYHEPGLLPKVLGYDKSAFLLEVKAFKDLNLYPSVELTEPVETSTVMSIKLKDQGGGIGPVKIFINGAEQVADARGPGFDPNKSDAILTVDLKRFERFLQPQEDNDITIVAYSRDNLPSRGQTLKFKPWSGKQIESPHLWALFVGVSKYQQRERKDIKDLRFAAKDAQTIARAFKIAGEGLFPGRVHITTLSTESEKPEEQPTKENIVKTLKEIAANPKVTASDILLFYMAGHGVSHGGADGDYYYLPMNAFTANLRDEDVRKQTALSGREIEDWILKIPTRKRVLILDTCAAGRFTQELGTPRVTDGRNERAWERMHGRTGLWVLAGSAADSVSYESSRYGQGVLTYSLLQAMKKDWEKVLEKDERSKLPELVDVANLFNYSANTVPELAGDGGGIQTPHVLSKQDARSFAIGRITSIERKDIPLPLEKPVYLRSNFQLESRPGDPLDLTIRLNEELNELSDRGIDAPLVFWDVPNHPGTYRISGRYTVDGAKLKKLTVFISAIVQEGEKVVEKDLGQPFSIEGDATKLDEAVATIVQEVAKRIPLPQP